jgi:hypothetical protein
MASDDCVWLSAPDMHAFRPVLFRTRKAAEHALQPAGGQLAMLSVETFASVLTEQLFGPGRRTELDRRSRAAGGWRPLAGMIPNVAGGSGRLKGALQDLHFPTRSHCIGSPGAALAHRLRLAGGGILPGLSLGLAVDLGAQQHNQGRKIEPGQQHHDRAE